MPRTLIPLLAATTALWSTAALAQSADAVSVCETALMQGDTDNDAMMSEEEILTLRDAEFEVIDANSDGSIDRTEWENCVGRTEEARARAAEATDVAGAGQWVDFDTGGRTELHKADWADLATEAWESGSAEEQSRFAGSADMSTTEGGGASEGERFARAAADRFRSYDRDGDEVLTQEEYEAAASAPMSSDEALSARFDSLDADGSGTISEEEYRSAADVEPADDGDTAEVRIGVPVIEYFILVY